MKPVVVEIDPEAPDLSAGFKIKTHDPGAAKFVITGTRNAEFFHSLMHRQPMKMHERKRIMKPVTRILLWDTIGSGQFAFSDHAGNPQYTNLQQSAQIKTSATAIIHRVMLVASEAVHKNWPLATVDLEVGGVSHPVKGNSERLTLKALRGGASGDAAMFRHPELGLSPEWPGDWIARITRGGPDQDQRYASVPRGCWRRRRWRHAGCSGDGTVTMSLTNMMDPGDVDIFAGKYLCAIVEPSPDVFFSACGNPVETDPNCAGYVGPEAFVFLSCEGCRKALGLP